jgi:hypothetical protein
MVARFQKDGQPFYVVTYNKGKDLEVALGAQIDMENKTAMTKRVFSSCLPLCGSL